MEIEVIWTEPALDELNEIYNYIFEQRSEKAADKVSNAIVDATERLSKFPQLGGVEEQLNGRKKTYRSLIEGYYKIIYYVEENNVYIALIWDCRQNPLRLLDRLR